MRWQAIGTSIVSVCPFVWKKAVPDKYDFPKTWFGLNKNKTSVLWGIPVFLSLRLIGLAQASTDLVCCFVVVLSFVSLLPICSLRSAERLQSIYSASAERLQSICRASAESF